MTLSVAVPPVSTAQLSARNSIEFVDVGGQTSSGIHLAVSGDDPIDVSFLVDIPDNVQQAFSHQITQISAPVYGWSATLEQKFARLAARVAAEKASPSERAEFSDLQASRQRLHLARSGADVLRDFEERQRTAALVQALKKYVEFASN